MDEENKVVDFNDRLLASFIEKRRPPEEIRDKLDLGYRREGQVVEIMEIRPVWDRPEEKQEIPVARAKYIKSRSVWRIYWMRADLKWHPYQPNEEVTQLSDFLEIVDQDAYGCFWG